MTLHRPDAALVTSLVEDSVTAPSLQNAQPWRFLHRVNGETIEVYGDPARTLPEADPQHRALHLGCGAAVLNMRVGAAWRGWGTSVRHLPDPDSPLFLAEVTLHKATDPVMDDALAVLQPVLRRRRTSRFPYTDERVPQAVLDALRSAALLEGSRLLTPGPWHTDTVLDLVHDSELFEAMDTGLRAELASWVHTGAGRPGSVPEGIPPYAIGPRKHGTSAPVREFDAPRRVTGRESARFEERPQILLLGTEDDRPADWLRAGQAMQRVLLQAALDGLATSVISQPLEWPELRAVTRDPRSTVGYVHMIIRIGYGPAGQATPRRPVADVLDFV
ncbi:Acg family FMN-binding oxidoreductase [Streptomyces sp. NPDC093089]|uniref:Acg family FMN-binding oxidoreductase n=1 Tax=Streptomyces sp. NPDC093089 TaxID=3366024 RepID=UPI0038166F00